MLPLQRKWVLRRDEGEEDRSSHSVPEFELGDRAADIQHMRGAEGGKRTGGRGIETDGGSQGEETTPSAKTGVSEEHASTEKSDLEMDTCTEGEGEASTSQSHSRYKKGLNIYTDGLRYGGNCGLYKRTTRTCTTKLMNI